MVRGWMISCNSKHVWICCTMQQWMRMGLRYGHLSHSTCSPNEARQVQLSLSHACLCYQRRCTYGCTMQRTPHISECHTHTHIALFIRVIKTYHDTVASLVVGSLPVGNRTTHSTRALILNLSIQSRTYDKVASTNNRTIYYKDVRCRNRESCQGCHREERQTGEHGCLVSDHNAPQVVEKGKDDANQANCCVDGEVDEDAKQKRANVLVTAHCHAKQHVPECRSFSKPFALLEAVPEQCPRLVDTKLGPQANHPKRTLAQSLSFVVHHSKRSLGFSQVALEPTDARRLFGRQPPKPPLGMVHALSGYKHPFQSLIIAGDGFCFDENGLKLCSLLLGCRIRRGGIQCTEEAKEPQASECLRAW
eukprot:m.97440 g.97440  ORF g.97440 m.97440 type:complete len:363 (-) comp10216_c1_seq1:128-1216(-)